MHKEPILPKLGDRVVNLNSDGHIYIPFGLMGTVTAVCANNEFVEILFDDEFFGGITCNHRLPVNRGAYVNPRHLLNLTQ